MLSVVKVLWIMFVDDWGVVLAILLPIVALIAALVWFSEKEPAKVYEEVVPLETKVDSIQHLKYKGHRYIWIQRHYRGGLVHDPDCPCRFGCVVTNIEWQSKSAYCVGE